MTEAQRFFANTQQLLTIFRSGYNNMISNGYDKITLPVLDAGILVFTHLDPHFVIQRFIKLSHNSWDQIKDSNENFFEKNKDIFLTDVSPEKLNIFVDLFKMTDTNGNFLFTTTQRKQAWTIMGSLVKISIKYVHLHRDPYSIVENDKIAEYYGSDFILMRDLWKNTENGIVHVNMVDHVKCWNMKLEFPRDDEQIVEVTQKTGQLTVR